MHEGEPTTPADGVRIEGECGVATSSLAVRRVSDLADIRASVPEWAALHDASGSTNPFSGPEWPVLWFERFLGPRDQPWVLQVRDGDELVAVVPLCRRESKFGPTLLQSLGTASPWIGPFEIPSPVAAPEHARAAMRAVVEHLVDRGDQWDWAELHLGSVVPWFEPEWIPGTGATAVLRGVTGTAVLPLGEGADSGAGSRRNLKESVRRARNRLTRAYGSDGWSVRRVVDADEIGAAFDRLARMHAQRARRAGKRAHLDVFADQAIRRYVRDVVVAMATEERASIYELCVGDRVITAQLVLATAVSSYFSVSGMTDDAWEFSPVTYVQWIAVEDATAAAHVEMNLSAGPNQTKLRWTREVRSHPEFALVGPRTRSRTLFRAATAVAAVRAFDEAIRAQHPGAGR